MTKAIVLFSGGLDSMLAVRVLQEQGVECLGLNIVTPFHDCSQVAAEQAEAVGIELLVERTRSDYLELVMHPRWGYGKALNPCVDCRVMMCRLAAGMLEQQEADFVATGEVIGQRPNSQKLHQLNLIARESRLEGRLLRPLSAGLMMPGELEKQGRLDRKRLYSFTGRGRVPLMTLAKELGLEKMPQPSTGCLLCEKSYMPRLQDLFKYEAEPCDWDIAVLNIGRQLRIDLATKCAVSRNEEQGIRLRELFNQSGRRSSLLLVPENFMGPTVLMVGPDPAADSTERFEAMKRLAAALLLRFTPREKYDPFNALITVKYGSETVLEKAAIFSEVYRYDVIGAD